MISLLWLIPIGLIALASSVWLLGRVGQRLAVGRIESGGPDDFGQAVEQMEAMRGTGSETPGNWDGVDRLGSAGMDRGGGTL